MFCYDDLKRYRTHTYAHVRSRQTHDEYFSVWRMKCQCVACFSRSFGSQKVGESKKGEITKKKIEKECFLCMTFRFSWCYSQFYLIIRKKRNIFASLMQLLLSASISLYSFSFSSESFVCPENREFLFFVERITKHEKMWKKIGLFSVSC